MNFYVGKVYQKGDKYRFIVSSEEGEKGYESEIKKNISVVRAKIVKFLKENDHKVYM